jgi:hypothetical protein
MHNIHFLLFNYIKNSKTLCEGVLHKMCLMLQLLLKELFTSVNTWPALTRIKINNSVQVVIVIRICQHVFQK